MIHPDSRTTRQAMGRRTKRQPNAAPQQENLNFRPPPSSTPSSRVSRDPNQLAKRAVARRGKPSAKPGNVKLTLTLDLPRSLAETLTTQAISEEKSLEGLDRE